MDAIAAQAVPVIRIVLEMISDGMYGQDHGYDLAHTGAVVSTVVLT